MADLLYDRINAPGGGGVGPDVALKMSLSDSGLYVSPVEGDDLSDGLSPGSAKATLEAAVTAMPTGGEITALGGELSYGTTLAPPLLVNGSMTIKGMGEEVTKLLYTGTGPAVLVGTGHVDNWAARFFMEDLTLVGNPGADVGVRYNAAHFCGLRRMKVVDFTKVGAIGVDLLGGVANYLHKFDHVYVRNVPTGARFASIGGIGANSCHWTDGWFGVHSTEGLLIDEGDNNLITKTEFNGSQPLGSRILGDANDNVFVKCTYDGPTVGAEITSAVADNNMFIGCHGLPAGLHLQGTGTIVQGNGSVIAKILNAYDFIELTGTDANLLFRGSNPAISMEQINAIANVVFATRRVGEAQRYFSLTGAGKLEWGPGEANLPDVNLSRVGTNTIGMGAGDHFKIDGAWNGGTLQLGTRYLWVDATGDLRIKVGAPTSDTDGVVVGTQT